MLLVGLYINKGRRYHQAMSDLYSNPIPITCYGAEKSGIAGRWELALNGPHKRLFSASLVLSLTFYFFVSVW